MSEAKIQIYKGPAGGWGALRSVAHQLLQHRIALKGARTLLSANQPDGFDCPGCAWPDRQHTSSFEFCENGVKAVAAEATADRATPERIGEHTVTALRGWTDHDLEALGRLTEPLAYDPTTDRYRRITWDEAFATVARHLQALPSPDEAIFYTSGRTSNEAAFLYQLFVREFGTNNFPDCSNMCHEPSGVGMKASVGVGKGTVTLDDFELADCLLIFGQNPGTNHPRMLTALEETKRNGGSVVAVNPLPEAGLIRFKNPQTPRGVVGKGTVIADQHLKIRPGGDLALFQMLNRLLLEAEDAAPGTVLDHDFIASDTTGYDEFAAAVREVPWDDVLTATGLTREEIEELRDRVLGARSVIVCWAMGLTQHRHGVPTIREIVNFLLLRGNLGRPGAGVCPVRGHSNVQGDRTMGIWEKMPDSFLGALEAEFGFTPPTKHGYDSVAGVRAMRDGAVRVFVGVGGNFVRAMSDTDVTEEALRRCRLTVQISTKLNRSHTVCGETALILPTLGRTDRDVQASGEQWITVEDSMSEVHVSRGRLEPASPSLLSEVAIICRLARATLGPGGEIPWEDFEGDYSLIRDRIARVVPGFEDFNARVGVSGGFRLPNPVNRGVYPTPSGKAVFARNDFDMLTAPPGHLVLQSLRSHDQWNTIPYAPDDRYRGIHGSRQVVMVNPDDLAELGLEDRELVDIVSVWTDGSERRAPGFHVVAYPAARGSAAAYYPEANVLVPLDSVAAGSNTPTYKGIIVRLERVTA